MQTETSPARANALPLSVVLGISFVAPVILFLGGMILCAQLVMADILGFGSAFVFTLPIWLSWVVFAPMAVLLANRFPFARAHLFRNAAIHFLVFIAICVFNWQVVGRLSEVVAKDFPLASRVPLGVKPPLGARVVVDFLTYGILICIRLAVDWSMQAKERERRALMAETHLAKARLSALRMQLHPHFLFNALNGISTLVHTDPAAADDMIANLSTLLRLSLDRTDEQEIPIRRELDFLQCYLAIEQVRYGDRLRFQAKVDPETLTAFVPALLLQPIMENAVRHGLSPQSQTVTIHLETSIKDGMLHLAVSDDGCGLPPSIDLAAEASHGIGLSNTRARLAELYGDKYSLDIRSGSSEESSTRGCIVSITLPHHTEAIL